MGILGIDIGGTNMRAGLVKNQELRKIESLIINKAASETEILDDLINLIRRFNQSDTKGIGVGVPGTVDAEKGIAYDIINIPSWKEVHLKEILEKEFKIPVYVNNDANCFAAGEKYFGEGKDYKNIVGLIIGTGLGSGLILNNHLYTGVNCGAGEFGMVPYKSENYEYYCSGQFFKNEYNMTGEEVFTLAAKGDETSINIFNEFGTHLGEAIKMICYAIDPEIIILGGSVSKSFKYFSDSMWKSVNQFAYKNSLAKLKILVSVINNVAILGSAALFLDAGIENKN